MHCIFEKCVIYSMFLVEWFRKTMYSKSYFEGQILTYIVFWARSESLTPNVFTYSSLHTFVFENHSTFSIFWGRGICPNFRVILVIEIYVKFQHGTYKMAHMLCRRMLDAHIVFFLHHQDSIHHGKAMCQICRMILQNMYLKVKTCFEGQIQIHIVFLTQSFLVLTQLMYNLLHA